VTGLTEFHCNTKDLLYPCEKIQLTEAFYQINYSKDTSGMNNLTFFHILLVILNEASTLHINNSICFTIWLVFAEDIMLIMIG